MRVQMNVKVLNDMLFNLHNSKRERKKERMDIKREGADSKGHVLVVSMVLV